MDLSTTYLGMKLKHPVMPSASPLSQTLDGIRRLEDAGAAAIVLYSLFEEEIEGESHLLEHYLNFATDSTAEALSYFPDISRYNVGPDAYIRLIQDAKAAVDVPIIASLNGASTGGWVDYARHMQDAGADALELNIYYIATDIQTTATSVEERYLDVVRAVKAQVSIPIAVKVGPYFSAFANMALRMAKAGADGLVLFNRFYQPDLDLEQLQVTPNLVLSSRHELRLPLRWIAILHGRVPVDLALTTGVHTHEDVLKGLMAGAKVTMMASELLRNGIYRIEEIVKSLEVWLETLEYESVVQMQGSMSQQNVAEPDAFERANYMKVLQSWRADPNSVLLH